MSDEIQFFLFILLLLFVYFLPSLVAVIRKTKNKDMALVINLFLGWTLIGWVAAMVVAYSGEAMNDYVKCSSCQSDISKKAVKCPHCGAEVEQGKLINTTQSADTSPSAINTRQCPYCEAEISATAKKCRFCGEWVTNETKV